MNNVQQVFLMIDAGSTSTRGLVYNDSGNILFKYQINTIPTFLPNGWVEQDPSTWADALIKILKESSVYVKSHLLSIEAISLTAQRSSVIPLDSNGIPLYKAIMWQGNRTVPICKKMECENDSVYKKTGLKISPVFSAVKMKWLKENEPGIYKRTHKMAGVQDFLLNLLTGKFVTDHSFASRTNLFNLEKLNWDDDLIKLFDIDDRLLNELIAPGSVCGYLKNEIAFETGLTQGIPIISAGGDQQCAALGLGAYESGKMVAITGTGSYLLAISKHPVLDSQMRLCCNVAAIPGQFLIEASILATGTIYRWFNEQFFPSSTNDESLFSQIDREAGKSTPGANGVIMLPYFQGRGTPSWNPNATGGFFNLTLKTKRCDMVRAILEGIILEKRENLDLMEHLVGEIDEINVSGGLTKFDLYNQLQADILNKKILEYENTEATSTGAWISTVKTLGIYEDYSPAFKSLSLLYKTKEFNAREINVKKFIKIQKRKQALYSALSANDLFDNDICNL